jgi:HAD superfamily hydrolase (TIGR01509 family)
MKRGVRFRRLLIQHGIEAILWDLDGTLALTLDLYLQANQAVARQFGIQLSDTFGQEVLGMSETAIWRHACKKYDLPITEEDWISTNAEHFEKLLPGLKPRRGALETWRLAESLGITQAVVTNVGREETIAKLNILGIYNENLVVVAGDNVRLAKPHREPYKHAAKRLQTNPRNCVVIEDSPPGARSALVAGMRVIGWGMNPETVFPKGTTTIGPEESPQEIIQHWHGETGRRRTVEQLPLRIRLRIEGMGDRGRTIKASVSEQTAKLRRSH